MTAVKPAARQLPLRVDSSQSPLGTKRLIWTTRLQLGPGAAGSPARLERGDAVANRVNTVRPSRLRSGRRDWAVRLALDRAG
jgi:hypothetical protein